MSASATLTAINVKNSWQITAFPFLLGKTTDPKRVKTPIVYVYDGMYIYIYIISPRNILVLQNTDLLVGVPSQHQKDSISSRAATKKQASANVSGIKIRQLVDDVLQSIINLPPF